ncbi:MAG TPA: hypothetical protein VGI10_13330 [Polyangiaceae bacterium]
MPDLQACPFCRALYAPKEATNCSECGVRLVPLENLPPSRDLLEDETERGELVLPEQRALPWNYFGSGRGVLLMLAALGVASFFLPWVEIHMPESAVRSGFDLARGRAGWLWGGAAGWLVLIPLVWTRRTIARMRGVRLVTALFPAMTLIEVMMLISLPPHGRHSVPVAIEWRWGIFVSFFVAAAGVIAGIRFGGSLRDLPRVLTNLSSTDPRETSRGQTLH